MTNSIMAAQTIWFKVMNLDDQPQTKVQLNHASDVDDLKKAITDAMKPTFDGYASSRLILKAKRNGENDGQAIQLQNPREFINSVIQRFGDNFELLVYTPPGK
jgi:hypothetical protein